MTIVSTNIEDTTAERHFYTVKDHEDEYVWENYYAKKVEPLMNCVITKILSACSSALLQNHSTIITPAIKEKLAYIMIYQLLRGKQSRDFTRQKYNESLPGVVEKAREIFGPLDTEHENVLEVYRNDENKYKLVAMEATIKSDKNKRIVSVLIQRSFIVYKIIGDKEFVASDNPVIFVNASTLDATPFRHGLAQQSTVVLYPLSPKVLIAAYHPEFFMGGTVDYDGKYVLLDSNIKSGFIENHNKMQYEQCFDQVFARTKGSLEDI